MSGKLARLRAMKEHKAAEAAHQQDQRQQDQRQQDQQQRRQLQQRQQQQADVGGGRKDKVETAAGAGPGQLPGRPRLHSISGAGPAALDTGRGRGPGPEAGGGAGLASVETCVGSQGGLRRDGGAAAEQQQPAAMPEGASDHVPAPRPKAGGGG